MTATDEIQLKPEEKTYLVPPPRWPPTALGAEVLPPPPPRPNPPPPTRRVYLVAYLVRRPGLLRTLTTGVLLGAFAAITRLGPHPFSLRGVAPVLAAGAVFGAVVATVLRTKRRNSNAPSYPLLALAGAVGGIVWWVMVHPSSALMAPVVLGALLAQGVVAFERWVRQAAA
jgi:hypothetical protein